MSWSNPRVLLQNEIEALRDMDLLRWYRKLKVVRQERREDDYHSPDQIRWCYYEARRELTRRGIKKYDDSRVNETVDDILAPLRATSNA